MAILPFADATRVTWRDDKATRSALRRVGANLLRLRLARNWSQEEAASQCNMSLQQTYQQIEAAKVNVTIHTLARLAGGFGVEIRDLFAPQR